MRARLIMAPRWVLALYFFLSFAVLMGLFTAATQGTAPGALTVGLAGGAFFSAVMTPLTVRHRDRMLTQLGQVTPEQYLAAAKASWRGPVPSDPDRRREALVLAREGLRQARQLRWAGLILFGTVLAVELALLVTGDAAPLVTVPGLLMIVVFFALLPGRLQKRVARLEAAR